MTNLTKIPQETYFKLVSWANKMAFYYYSPVLLVGSSVYKEDFRDIDVLIVINDSMFERRFLPVDRYLKEAYSGQYSKEMWAISKECEKRYIDGCDSVGFNLDVKIIPKTYFNQMTKSVYPNKKLVRLDSSDYQ